MDRNALRNSSAISGIGIAHRRQTPALMYLSRIPQRSRGGGEQRDRLSNQRTSTHPRSPGHAARAVQRMSVPWRDTGCGELTPRAGGLQAVCLGSSSSRSSACLYQGRPS